MFSGNNFFFFFHLRQEVAYIPFLADLNVGDWFGGFLYSAGQQANEAVQDQLSALSFSRFYILYSTPDLFFCISSSEIENIISIFIHA